MAPGRLKWPRLSWASLGGDGPQHGELEGLLNTDSWTPSPQIPSQLVMGRARESTFLTSSQVILVHRSHFEEH